ncbi:MAG: hypothetical protein ACYDBJ_21635 [Aggregatilineales bacterium]
MTVERLKSHTLRRDEKGLFGIPFKRLLVAGMSGGIVLSLTQNALGDVAAFAIAFACALVALMLTASRGGIPLWRRLIYGVRARAILLALDNPQLRQWLKVSSDELTLDASRLFRSAALPSVTEVTDWALYRDPTDLSQALALVDSPTPR